MNARRSRRERTGFTSTDTAARTLVKDLFEKARTHERLEQLKAAREHDLLPYFREVDGEPGPGGGRWRAASGSRSARTTTWA